MWIRTFPHTCYLLSRNLLSYDSAVSCLSMQIPCSPMWQVLQSWCLHQSIKWKKRWKRFSIQEGLSGNRTSFSQWRRAARYYSGHAAFTNVIFNWFSFGNLFFLPTYTIPGVGWPILLWSKQQCWHLLFFHTLSDTYFFFSHLFNCISYFNGKKLSILNSWSSHYSCQNMTF